MNETNKKYLFIGSFSIIVITLIVLFSYYRKSINSSTPNTDVATITGIFSVIFVIFIFLYLLKYFNVFKELYNYTSLIKYILSILFQIIVLWVIVYYYNLLNISTNFPAYALSGCLIITFILLLFLVNYFVKFFVKSNSPFSTTSKLFRLNDEKGIFIKTITGLFGLFLLGIIPAIIVWIFLNSSTIVSWFYLLFIIVLLAIIYIQLKPYFSIISQKSNDVSFNNNIFEIVWLLIMYVPGLLISFIEYIKNEYRITTKPVWILLAIEAILVVLWVIFPKTFNYFINSDGINLLNNPIYLNKLNNLGDVTTLYGSETKQNNTLYTYSISAWFYINSQPSNTNVAYSKWTSILNYNNKPTLEYNGQKNSLRVVSEINSSDSSLSGTETSEIFNTSDIIYQKWNNIVINYDRGTMDVFLNGVLVGTSPNIVTEMEFYTIQTGEDNGIQGGICNVMYYNHIITERNISLTYNLLKDKNPPIL
jgi:hypothetical protein